jgi:hypothetical protein
MAVVYRPWAYRNIDEQQQHYTGGLLLDWPNNNSRISSRARSCGFCPNVGRLPQHDSDSVYTQINLIK